MGIPGDILASGTRRSGAFPLLEMNLTSNGNARTQNNFRTCINVRSLSFYRQDDEVTGGSHRLGSLC
jgi:hypothetical protein